MYILAWPLSAVVITLIAWMVNRIANRPKAAPTSEQSMEAHQRFLQVLENPVPDPKARTRR